MKQNVLNFGKTWTNMTMLLALILGMGNVWAQTTLISPTGSGGMEIGGVPTGTPSTDFAANGWTVVNGANNRFFVGTAGTVSAGTYHAFTGPNASTWSGQAAASVSHIYQDVFVPAGESIISVSLRYKISVVDAGWDFLKVHLVPTSTVPVDGVQLATGQLGANIDGTTAYTTYTLGGAAPATGANMRVVISFRSDGVTPHGAAAVDEIHVTSAAPATFTATAQGGLWNSPATWVGGVVPPAANDIVIPAGSTVVANQVLNYRDLTVNGNLQFTTLTTAAPFHTLTRNLEVGATGNLHLTNAAAGLNQINIGGDFTNNGLVNAVPCFINFNGSGNSQISGSGTFIGTGGRGILRGILAQNNGTFTLNQSQDLTVTQSMFNTSNNFVSNNKLRIDNAVDVFQNTISQLITTNMGSGYTTAPVVLGQTVSPWVANGTAILNTRYYSGTNVYVCTAAGTFGASAPIGTTPATETNGTATLLWVGNLGNLGNAFQVTAVTAGTQYYCGDNLYICTVAGTPSAAAPPTHTSGTAVSGTATFAYVGSVAIASVNWDAVTGTVRSLDLVTGGSGYQSIPTIVITNTGAGSGAAASAVIFQSAGPVNSLALKATASTFTGSVDPRHSNAPAGEAGNGVYSVTTASYGWYNSPVAIGFSGARVNNLVTNQGSGYTSAPTVSISGGTTVGTGSALTFQVNVADGRVISVYCTGGTQAYSVPPALTLTGGGGTGATIDWGTSWPTATVNLSNSTSGYITSIDVTNNGFGFAAAPTVVLRPVVAGETAALLPTCRLQQLNIQWGFFLPQSTNPNNNSIMALVPANGRVNQIIVTNGSQTFTSNVEATAATGLGTFGGIIDMDGNNLRFSHPDYTGTAGTVGAYVNNGSVELSYRGGNTTSATRTFPIGGGTGATAHFVHTTGTGTVSTGFTYTGVRVSRFNSPSGTVSPAGNITGIRGVRMDLVGSGTLTNLNAARTVQMFWNILDNLASNNPSIFVAQATDPTGAWTVRSTSTGTGALPTSGSRTTATAAPGPIAMSNTMYFAWVNNGFTPPPALAYNATRTTGNTYNSIASVAKGGNGTGVALTGWSTSIANDEEQATINLSGWANTFQGSTITGVRVHTNGFLQIINGTVNFPTNPWDNNMALTTAPNVVAPFWEDLVNKTTGGNTRDNSIIHAITGTTPNRVLTVEWSNMSVFGAEDAAQLYFQVQLFENTGEIRINYGDHQMFNGTTERRYSYSAGIKGGYNTAYPTAGQVFAQQYENHNSFSHIRTQTAHLGANGLAVSPEPRSSFSFIPGAYTDPGVPASTPPSNDDFANYELITALGSFPNNIAWNQPDNKPRIYTTRFATTSAPANCGTGPANQKDVWFVFQANEANVTTRIYSSGGYIARVQAFETTGSFPSLGLGASLDCAVGLQGLQTDLALTGLTIGNYYAVRVSHDLVGNQAVFTANTVASGNISGLTINDGGTNYTVAPATFNGPAGMRMLSIGGGGNTFVGSATTVAGGVITGGTFDGGNDYTSIPTIEVEQPDWGITGEFAIVIYAPPANDNCDGAIELTNLTNTSCVAGQNSRVGVTTTAATASSETLGSCASGADDDLWYTFTAIGTSTVVSVTGNNGFNPALQIWSGSNCGTKTVVSSPAGGCVNNTGVNGTEEVTLTTTIGTTYYVRVYHEGTGSGGPGANFDICILGSVPACATLTAPANSSTGLGSSTTLTWNATTGATGYDVYLSTNVADVNTLNPSALVSSNQAGLTYNATGLNIGTTYHWIVIPRNSNGAATGCSNVFSFTTSNENCTFLAYPAVFASSDADTEISSVTVGTMTNNLNTCSVAAPGAGSIAGRYSNFTASVAGPSMLLGEVVNFSITQSSCGGNFDNGIQLYIDWNQDGDFLDAGETVFAQITPVTGTHTVTGSFTVPWNAVLGSTRMRVVVTENYLASTNYAHTAYTWGETEDYCITVNAIMTQLQAGSCGATNVTGNQLLFATNVNMPAYRFRFTGPNNGGPGWNNNQFVVDRPNRYVYFNHLVPGFQFGATYSVEVAAGDGNGNFGPYGTACNVTLQSNVPLTQIQTSQCGASVGGNTLIFANQIFGAQGYRFRITGPNNGGSGWNNNQFIVDRTSRNFYFSWLVPGATPGATFSVEVAYLQNDGVTYSPYGAACNITLIAPTTQIQASQCGTINLAPNTLVFANQVFDAQGYRFRVSGPNNGGAGWVNDQFVFNRPSRDFTFQWNVPGFIPGSTYQVEVAYLTNDGVTYSAYGASCNISLFAPLQTPINSNNDIFVDNKTMNVVEFGANASHNPFTTDFGIQVLNANDVETINVSVYDMSGKLIERQAVNPMDIETVRFGMNLASGMYMIEVRQGVNQAVIRQVKN